MDDTSRRTLLADERTYLAWSRTGLAAFAVAIGVGAIVPAVAGGTDWLYVGLGLGYSLLGMAFFGYGPWRLHAVTSAVGRGVYTPADTRIAIGLTTFSVALGLVTMGAFSSTRRAHRDGPRNWIWSDAQGGVRMSDNDQLDVLIAVYLVPDLAKRDFDDFVERAKAGEIDTNGVVLVTKDADGEVTVQETGDHLGKKGAKVGAGAGLVLGLFAPPLLAATAVGAAAGGLMGKFARKRVQSGIGEKMDDALPPGSAGVIAIYEHADADAVAGALTNSIRSSTAQIDKASAKELKAGLEEASAGLGG